MFKYILFILFLITAEQVNAQSKNFEDTALKVVSENIYSIGNVIINSNTKEIRFPAKVNMTSGLVEVALCGPMGKLHESIFVTDAKPSNLQIALLLLGLEPPENYQFGDSTTLRNADKIDILVEWKVDEKLNQLRVEDFIWNEAVNQMMQRTKWAFIGSKVINGIFIADEVQSIITTYNDPSTIIDNPTLSGINDELFIVNEKLIPPKGTEVQFILNMTKEDL